MPQTAPTRAATQSAEALDWANDLAAAIIADVFSRRYTEAQSLIAARLRLVKCEGERDGLDRASAQEHIGRPKEADPRTVPNWRDRGRPHEYDAAVAKLKTAGATS